ncbi:MAG: hypothetical protein JWQ98_912 [Chlorobi bacterium]|nr:hypothetical protein [Chlorobiota bacterium]
MGKLTCLIPSSINKLIKYLKQSNKALRLLAWFISEYIPMICKRVLNKFYYRRNG